MVLRILLSTIVLLLALIVSGCGGGGGGSTASSPPASDISVDGTVGPAVSGVASKGIIVSGTVRIYAVTEQGQKGALLGSGTTDANGRYHVGFGDYQGALLVEVSGGSYVDEATGADLSIPSQQPLRAIVHDTNDDLTTAVTPLTELAVMLAEQAGDLSPEHIMMANGQISHFFGVDIVSVMPVLVGDDGFDGGDLAQQNYSLLLAAISQMMENEGEESVAALLAQLLEEIRARLGEAEYGAPNGLMPENFEQAREQFLAGNGAAQEDLEQGKQQQLDEVREELVSQKILVRIVGDYIAPPSLGDPQSIDVPQGIYGVNVMLALPAGSCEEVVEDAEGDRELQVNQAVAGILRDSGFMCGLYDFNHSYIHESIYGGPLINLAAVYECPFEVAINDPYYANWEGYDSVFSIIIGNFPVGLTVDDIEILSAKVVDHNGVEVESMKIELEVLECQKFED